MDNLDLDAPFQRIARLIDANAMLVRHWPLEGGVSATINALEILIPPAQNRKVVVRYHGTNEWKPLDDNDVAMEYEIQRVLFQAALPVAEPLLLDTSQKVLPAPYLVMEMVEGTSFVEESHVKQAVCAMADFLARLHCLDIDASAMPLLPCREDPVAGALEYVPDITSWRTLREAISDWQTTTDKDTFLHGDFWPGNILWNDNHIAAVIDWEDAAIGPPVSDLAVSRVEIMTMYGEQAMETFTRHYLEKVSLNLSDLALWEVYVGFAALATMHSWRLAPEVEAKRRTATTFFVNRAAQVLITRASS